MTNQGESSSHMTSPPARNYDDYIYAWGRWYHKAGNMKYMFPIDEEEKDRLDIFHKIFLVAREEGLFMAPVRAGPNGEMKILDLGCGTGIWAIDVADRYPNAHVTGLDLSLIQPSMIPKYVRFARVDIEEPWQGIPTSSYDLVHMRAMYGAIAHWHAVYTSVLQHLKPGGYLEQVEIDWEFREYNEGQPGERVSLSNSIIRRWNEEWMSAMDLCGRSMTVARVRTVDHLINAGFVEIREEVIPLPCNGWSENEKARDLGRWFHLGLTQGIDALTRAPMCAIRHIKEDDVNIINDKVKREISSRNFRAYCNLHIWTARRPAAS